MQVEYYMFKEVMAGACAGVTGTVLGFPLDSIKTRLQTHTIQLNEQKMTIPKITRLIYSEGGLLGFYRGIAAPLVSLVILNTMTFSAYAALKKKFGVPPDTAVFGLNETLRVASAAACVGPVSALISTPFEMIKTQMQLSIKLSNESSHASTKTSLPRSSLLHATHLVKQHGVRVLYIGHGVNTCREMLFLATYFTVYENMKSSFISILSPSLAIPFAGGLSGAMGWFVSFPLDCVKANIQGRQLPHGSKKTAYSVANDLLKARGVLGLYAGLMPSIARAFLVSSSRFSAYELTMWILR